MANELLIAILFIIVAFHMIPASQATTTTTPALDECFSYCEEHRYNKESWPNSHYVYCSNSSDKNPNLYPDCSEKCREECSPICHHSTFLERYYFVCPVAPSTTIKPYSHSSRKKNVEDGTNTITYIAIAVGSTLAITCFIMCVFAACRQRIARRKLRNSVQPAQTHPLSVLSGYGQRNTATL